MHSTSVFAKDDSAKPLFAVLNAPMTPPALEDFAEVKRVRREVGETVDPLAGDFAGRQGLNLALQAEGLFEGRPIQVAFQISAGPQRPLFEPSMRFGNLLNGSQILVGAWGQPKQQLEIGPYGRLI